MVNFLKTLGCAAIISILGGRAAYAQVTLSASAAQALVVSAVQYEHAEGVPRDLQKAAALYCEAAKFGNVDAQFSLGWMYANGRGVVHSDAVAAKLFALAAKQGHAAATGMLQYAPAVNVAEMPVCMQPAPVKTVTAAEVSAIYPPTVYAKTPVSKLVDKLALKYEVDPQLVMAVIAVESGFNINARSPKNAQGLMQLIPETAQRFRVKDSFDAEENIKGGIAYLKWLLAYFKGNVQMVAAAYNAGEGAVEKYHGVPPYPETQDYVRKIARLYQKTDHPYQAGLVKASAMFSSVAVVRQ